MIGFKRKVVLEGLNLEKLIQQAGKAGIELGGVRRTGPRMLSCIVSEKEMERLQSVSEAGGWRISIGEHTGAGRLQDRIKSRMMLVACAGLMILLAVISSCFVWRVEVIDAGPYVADVQAYLQEMGVRPLVMKRSIDLAGVRDNLEWRYPEVAWVEVGWRGTTLQIRMIRGRAAGEAFDTTGSCDIIAKRDGIVAEIITAAGTPIVKAGQIVRKGEVLIKGEERTEKEGIRPVAARGKVMARVWDAAAVKTSLYETETVYTGRKHTSVRAVLPWFSLSKSWESEYRQQDVSVRELPVGGIFVPMTMRYETYLETHTERKKRDIQLVQAEAGEAAMQKLREKIRIPDDFVDKWVEFSMIDSEILCAVAYGERVIDIARTEERR